MSCKVDEFVANMNAKDKELRVKFEQLAAENSATQEDNRQLASEIKTKDDIIKTLTRENLLINSKLTEISAIVGASDSTATQLADLEIQLSSSAKSHSELQSKFDSCSNYLLEVEEKCQDAQSSCL